MLAYQMLRVILERCHFALTYLPELESVSGNMVKRGVFSSLITFLSSLTFFVPETSRENVCPGPSPCTQQKRLSVADMAVSTFASGLLEQGGDTETRAMRKSRDHEQASWRFDHMTTTVVSLDDDKSFGRRKS
jgi:hypothetical protein